jgi:competence protein CoiA
MGGASLLRCITEESKPLIATTCEPESTRALSRSHKLFCPNCMGLVQYNKGRVKSSYFSHVNLECEYIGSEPETPSHMKGKELLFGWLKSNFPTAYVEYEVHLPETGQIVDVYVRHNDGNYAGLVWAFEFQHSNISSTAWKERHELYRSAGIQDFWFLDKAKFMKFSSAKGADGARLRKDLEKTIFNETGLCYFLDLENAELTIDFNFSTQTSYVNIGRSKRVEQSLIYHDPEKHSAHLNKIKIRINQEFRFCVMVSNDFEKHMEQRLSFIVEHLRQAEADRIRQLLNERARDLIKFARESYGDGFANTFREIIPESKEELHDDVLNLDNSAFFAKYKSIVETSLSNLNEYASLKESTELVPRYLFKLANLTSFKMVKCLQEQGSLSLVDYLLAKYRDKISLVQYVYDKHKSVLDFLPTRRKDWINEKLGEISWELKTYAKEPDVIDYAIEYGDLKSIEEVENYIQQVDEKIVNYKPTFDPEDWDFEDNEDD